jgi:hypothetical protein
VKRSWFARTRRGGRVPAGSTAAEAEAELVCREAVELVTAYQEDALEAGPRAALERHLEKCPHCRQYFAQIGLVRQTASRVEPEDLSADARRDLMALYRDWRADPQSGSEEGDAGASGGAGS